MRVAIIGAGFTGLASALKLVEGGVEVEVFERENDPGGLAVGFKDKGWRWSLEKHYHHIFTSDTEIQKIADEVGSNYFFIRPTTSTLYNGRIWQLDSPLSLLRFGEIGLDSRIKTGLMLAYLRYAAGGGPFGWKRLEKDTAVEWLRGKDAEGFRVLWEPLLRAKFGDYADSVNAAWFWARIKKRSPSLGYFEGGFSVLAEKIEDAAKKQGAKFRYGETIERIEKKGGRFAISGQRFDKVLVTGASRLLSKLVPQLPEDYKLKLASYEGLGAVNLVLSLKDSFLKDGTYWLSINEKAFPFLAVVEHTNFVDKSHYGGDRLVYVGNYLSPGHKYFGMDENALVKIYLPYLKKINPDFSKSLIKQAWVFKAPFAQPVVGVNYSKKLLPFKTPLRGLYWASIQQVYPWDRGTNYAVELGEKVSKLIKSNER